MVCSTAAACSLAPWETPCDEDASCSDADDRLAAQHEHVADHPLEPRNQLVEARCQLTNLVPRVHLDLYSQIPVGDDTLHALFEARQWRDDGSAHAVYGQYGEEHDDEGRNAGRLQACRSDPLIDAGQRDIQVQKSQELLVGVVGMTLSSPAFAAILDRLGESQHT